MARTEVCSVWHWSGGGVLYSNTEEYLEQHVGGQAGVFTELVGVSVCVCVSV